MLHGGEPGMSFAGLVTKFSDHSLSLNNGYDQSAS